MTYKIGKRTYDHAGAPNDLDIKTLIMSLDGATGILGVQIKNKHNFTILVLLISIAIDCAVTIYGDFFVSPYNEKLLLELGNMAYFILNEKRQYLVSKINCYRINGMFLLFNHLFFDDYSWMEEANELFLQLRPRIIIGDRFYGTMRKLKFASFLNQVFFAFFENGTYVLTYLVVYPERLFIPSCIVYNYVSQIYSFVQIRFILQYHLVCDISADFVRQADKQIIAALDSGSPERIHDSLVTFGAVCQIVNRFNIYLKTVYIIYLTCSFAIIVPLLYAILYTGSTWINLFSLIAFLSYYIFLIGYLSHIAGKVDPMATSSGYRLYKEIVCGSRLLRNEKLSLKFKIQQYYDQTLTNVIGISFLGKPINTQTCVRVNNAFSLNCSGRFEKYLIDYTFQLITTFLTMLALLMSRYKKMDEYY